MKIPPVLLAVDVVGAILLGIGLAEHFANTNLVPADLQFQHYALVMISVGIALMMPMLTFIVKHVTQMESQPKGKQ